MSWRGWPSWSLHQIYGQVIQLGGHSLQQFLSGDHWWLQGLPELLVEVAAVAHPGGVGALFLLYWLEIGASDLWLLLRALHL